MFYSEKKFTNEIYNNYHNLESVNRRKTVGGTANMNNQKLSTYTQTLKENLNLTSLKKHGGEKELIDYFGTESNQNVNQSQNNVYLNDFSFRKQKKWNISSPTKSTKAINQSYSKSRSKSKPRTLNKKDFKNAGYAKDILDEDDEMLDLRKNIFKDFTESVHRTSEHASQGYSMNIVPITELSDSSRRESVNNNRKMI
jgi:hypothetical protein